jgi:hypothetical protein
VKLIRIYLPLRDNSGQLLDPALLKNVERELSDRFGGVTAHLEAPASGLWVDDGTMHADEVVVFEVMVEGADRAWWSAYRSDLERRFVQKSVLMVMQDVERL